MDRPRLDPCMGKLIVPKSIHQLTWVQPACQNSSIRSLCSPHAPPLGEHNISVEEVIQGLQERKLHHLWPVLVIATSLSIAVLAELYCKEREGVCQTRSVTER